MKIGGLVINGYYGMGNAGDEAVLACALDDIRAARPGIGITVLSGDPEATAKRYCVKAVGRSGFAAMKAIAGSQLYVSGGGSLLQDATSTASILYYLALMLLTRLMGRRYAVFANGIGPLRRGWVRGLVRMAMEGASSVSVRDAGSLRLLEEIGVMRDDILLTSDPVFGIKAAGREDVLREVVKTAGKQAADYLELGNGKLAIISLRGWAGMDEASPALREMADMLKRAGFMPLGLAFQPDQDRGPLEGLKEYGAAGIPVISCDFHPDVTAGIFEMAAITVGMRLHSLIMSAAAGVPALGVSYDPKVDALFEMLPLGNCVKVQELKDKGPTELKELIGELAIHKERLMGTLPAVRARAQGAVEFMLRKAEA